MLVKLKEDWFQFKAGSEVDLAKWKADDLIRRGCAEPVEIKQKQVRSPARNKAVRAAASK